LILHFPKEELTGTINCVEKCCEVPIFEVSTTLMMQAVFWVVTICSVVVGYQHFKVHAATMFMLKMEAA
jgi:hypothetical protein